MGSFRYQRYLQHHVMHSGSDWLFPAQIYNEERLWHFYVNKSNEEPRQVFRSKEIFRKAKVLFFCTI